MNDLAENETAVNLTLAAEHLSLACRFARMRPDSIKVPLPSAVLRVAAGPGTHRAAAFGVIDLAINCSSGMQIVFTNRNGRDGGVSG